MKEKTFFGFDVTPRGVYRKEISRLRDEVGVSTETGRHALFPQFGYERQVEAGDGDYP